ncbi:hypothetical protein OG539_32530 [Actinacidiphila glaucinigra]|uniref:hypothetical protein n=1 Tax=Actinacidiphila glaucinigra TaxID=235986 RepID=UPI003250C135
MTRNSLANTPTEASTSTIDGGLIERLTTALEAIARVDIDPELRAYTPAEAAVLLGKTENWVVESIQAQSIPFTRVGKSPRLRAAHIRQILDDGEVKPNRYSKPVSAAA